MLQAKSVKILLAEKPERAGGYRLRRGRVAASIKDRKFGDRAAGSIDGQHLLAAADRGLEDANIAFLDDVEASARLSFGKDKLASIERAPPQPGRQKGELRVREAPKKRYSFKQLDCGGPPGYGHRIIVREENLTYNPPRTLFLSALRGKRIPS